MILVLGAGGCVGSHLCAALDDAEVEYRAAFHTPAKLETAIEAGQDAVEIDLARPQTLRAAMQDISRVFLLTAASPEMAERERHAITAASKAGVELIVKISVWGAASESYAFARWHAPSEKALADSGVAHHILRPNGFMQSLAQSVESTVRDHGAYYTVDTSARAAYVDARDIAACAATLLTGALPQGDAQTIWEPTGPEALNATEVAKLLSAAIRRPVRATDIAPQNYQDSLLAAGLPQYLVEALVDMAVSPAASTFARITDDVKALTGQNPRSLKDFFEEHRDAFLG